MTDYFFTISGGPGSGKTALIEALREHGYKCVDEEARQIIREQMQIAGEALPWKNLSLFKQMLFERTVKTYQQMLQAKPQITFFDRDILDLIAYDRLTSCESSAI